ncbi:hypothetical protein PCK1_002405 [Pneumocystis canis]|nr:hypothetical protein PCK1_002405 [Pneumocystis canis]
MSLKVLENVDNSIEGLENKKLAKKTKPKRPLSAYLSFQLKTRQAVKDSLGENATQKEILSEIAERWSKLNDNEKKPFEEEARKAREQYEKEMTAYRCSSEYKNNASAVPPKENMETQMTAPPLKYVENKENSEEVAFTTKKVNEVDNSWETMDGMSKGKEKKKKHKRKESHESGDDNSLSKEKKERKKHKKKEGQMGKG